MWLILQNDIKVVELFPNLYTIWHDVVVNTRCPQVAQWCITLALHTWLCMSVVVESKLHHSLALPLTGIPFLWQVTSRL